MTQFPITQVKLDVAREPELLESFWGPGAEGKALFRECHEIIARKYGSIAGSDSSPRKPPAKLRQVVPRQPRQSSPDGLRTPAEAARKLGCSGKTLNGHVASGALRYVLIGHGRKRRRKMFADADINEFVSNQTRKDVPCPSIAGRTRRTGTTISGAEVIDFRLPRKRLTSVKREK